MLCTVIVQIRMYRVSDDECRSFDVKDFLFAEDFVLPREEARRLFRAYNHIWDLKIDENRIQRTFDGCSRNGHIVINDALKQLAN